MAALKIKYINDTFAHKSNGVIYLNKDLKKYPNLHKAVLRHEREHELHDDFTLYDLLHDLKSTLPKEEFTAWKRTHRKQALRMMMPINKFGINYNLIVIYSLMILSVGVIVWISRSLISLLV